MISVILTPDEVKYAAFHGVDRRTKKLEGKRGDREQKDRSTWDNEIEGACAELAWCKFRKCYWSGLSGLRSRDGGLVEIRWTKHSDGGLIVYKNDRPDAIFVLARGFAPTFFFVGWIRGVAAKEGARQTSFGLLLPAEKLNQFIAR